jgi:hypothetical protein
MARTKLPSTEAERQYECVSRVYYLLQLAGELPKKPKITGFHLEAYGKTELGLNQQQLHRVRARARKHIEKYHGRLPWWKSHSGR